MLVAELHGKTVQEAQDNEDLLTSCVFGHLRYLPPSVFWENFLGYAITVQIDGESKSLLEVLGKQGICLSNYSDLHVHFWPTHRKYGEPDLALVFSGANMRSALIFIEAKLWAEKSGTAENDQLVRYVRATHDLRSFKPPLPVSAAVSVVYLTPRESLPEVMETIALYGGPEAQELLFRIQWQDLIVAAEESLFSVRDAKARLILSNVAEFLRRRGLEYFKGFVRDSRLPLLDERQAAFYSAGKKLFSMVDLPNNFEIERGAWTK